MSKTYGLIVIGSGTAAMVAAHRTASAGWKVAVIDFRPYGGTCALRGCDPKKMLITGAQVIDDIRRMTGRGITAPEAQIDWRDLIGFKRTFTDPVPQKQEKRYEEKGIDAYQGYAPVHRPQHGRTRRRRVVRGGAHPDRIRRPPGAPRLSRRGAPHHE